MKKKSVKKDMKVSSPAKKLKVEKTHESKRSKKASHEEY